MIKQVSRLYGYSELALAMVCVGSSFVVAKVLTDTLPIFLANSIRFLFALVAVAPLLIRHWRDVRAIGRADFMRLAFLSLTGVFLFNVFLFLGLQHIGAGTSGVITSFAPIVLSVLAFVLLKEQMTTAKIMAIMTATVGILVINLGGAGSHDFSWLGFALIFGVVLCEAALTLTAKSVSKQVSPQLMSAVVLVCSTALFLPLGLWQAVTTPHLAITAKDWLLLAYLGVIVNAMTYFLWYSGLKKASASQAAVFTGIMPISALLLAYVFLGEPLKFVDVLGLALVLGGVFLVTKNAF
jgi:drug/metabolite transporter (DMT)-like permease